GYKATFDVWLNSGNWAGSPYYVFHTDTTHRKLIRSANAQQVVDANGFVHFVAYAEPSDGETQTVIRTDYINLEIELKPTAQLNTRGKIIRVENFEGKVSGSTVENPHTAKTSGSLTTLGNPLNAFNVEFVTEDRTAYGYGRLKSQDGN